MGFSETSLKIVIKFSLVEKNKKIHGEVLKCESMGVRQIGTESLLPYMAK